MIECYLYSRFINIDDDSKQDLHYFFFKLNGHIMPYDITPCHYSFCRNSIAIIPQQQQLDAIAECKHLTRNGYNVPKHNRIRLPPIGFSIISRRCN